MLHRLILAFFTLLTLSSEGFAQSPQQQREEIRAMRSDVLNKLYKVKPSVRKEIQQSVGYAVFSNIGVNVFLVSAAHGSGVTRDNRKGKDIYMKMASLGGGIGLGVKDFRAVFVFHNTATLDKFINEGWEFSGQADAAIKSNEKGDSASLAASAIGSGVSVYQLTENGIALQATLQGTKYWVDANLN